MCLFLATQASELQKLSLRMLYILRDYYVAWPERILRPVQFIRAILTAAPWTVNTIAIGRDLGAVLCQGQWVRVRVGVGVGVRAGVRVGVGVGVKVGVGAGVGVGVGVVVGV